MPITQKELKILKRTEERGGRVDWKALNRKFGFGTFGMISYDVDFSVFHGIREIVTDLADKHGFTCELTGILFSPMILRSDEFINPDFVKNKRASKAFHVGKNLDYETWKKSRKPNRVAIAAEFFRSSVESIPDRNLSRESKIGLIAMIDLAVAKLKSAIKPGVRTSHTKMKHT